MSDIIQEMNCFLTMETPQTFFECLITQSGDALFNIFFVAVVILMVGGWSSFRGIHEAMLIGGFLAMIPGLAILALGWISVGIWMFSLIITITGLVITVIKRNREA